MGCEKRFLGLWSTKMDKFGIRQVENFCYVYECDKHGEIIRQIFTDAEKAKKYLAELKFAELKKLNSIKKAPK